MISHSNYKTFNRFSKPYFVNTFSNSHVDPTCQEPVKFEIMIL